MLDVAIIGAGVAGSSAAFHLSNKNHQTIILEKTNYQEAKVCGGGMSSAVQKWFPFDLKPVVEEVIQTVEFTWLLKDPVIANLPGSSPFWIVQRQNLDKYLVNQAISSGANLLTAFNVIGIERTSNTWKITSNDGREIESKAIIIADGSNSPWAKHFQLGPRNHHHASTYSIRLKGKGNLKEQTARFEFGLVKHGFAWAFPLQEEINVGVGTFIGNEDSVDLNKILDSFLPDLGFDPSQSTFKKARLRVWNGHSSLHDDGIVLIGDAASLCDPFLAEGIRPALMSGYEAAKSLDYWLRGKSNNLSSYSIAMRKNWGNSMAWGKRISRVFYRFPNLGYRLGIKRPTAPERIAQILSGEMGYEDIAQRVIKRLLFQR